MRLVQNIKITQKLLMAAMAAALLICIHETAAADTITIGHASGGAVYRAYKLFDLTYQADGSSYAYTMKSDNPFFAAVKAFAEAGSNGLTLQRIGMSGTYNVQFDPAIFTGAPADTSTALAAGKAGELAAALRRAAQASPEQFSSCLAGSVTAQSDDQAGLVINVGSDNHGYYFVTTTSGSVFSLDSTAPDVTVYDKNVKPTLDKSVKEGDVFGDTSDGEIGSTVYFRTVIHSGTGAKGYVLHDAMDAGLRWNQDVKVYAEDPSYTGDDGISIDGRICRPLDEGSGTWQVSQDRETEPYGSFDVVFSDEWLESNVTSDRIIIVTYSAVITQAAAPGTALVNRTWLKYGENSRTAEDSTRTYTWEVNIYKCSSGQAAVPLKGAVFKILSGDKQKAAVITGGKLSGWAALAGGDVADDGKITAGSDLVTTASGKLQCAGLDAGTYYVVETAPPDGYNRLTAPVEITVRSSQSGSGPAAVRTAVVDHAAVIAAQQGADGKPLNPGDEGYDTASYIRIENKRGSLLPSTGGPGTRLIYGAGVLLILGAGALLFRRRI